MAFKTMKLDGVTQGLSIHRKDLEAEKNESEENEWKRPVIEKENKANVPQQPWEESISRKEWHLHKMLLVPAVGYLRMTVYLSYKILGHSYLQSFTLVLKVVIYTSTLLPIFLFKNS